MYVLKNALKNLGRNKNRNILVGIIIFSIIISTTVSLVIHNTTKEIILDYKNQFGSKITLSVDFDKLMSEVKPDSNGSISFPTAPEISSDQYINFAKSEYLKSYQMKAEAGIILDGLKAIDEGKSGGIDSIGGGQSNGQYIAPTAKLLGYTDETKITDFIKGVRKIIEGDYFKKQNECLISSDFAKLNNLKVGSEFQISDSKNKDKK